MEIETNNLKRTRNENVTISINSKDPQQPQQQQQEKNDNNRSLVWKFFQTIETVDGKKINVVSSQQLISETFTQKKLSKNRQDQITLAISEFISLDYNVINGKSFIKLINTLLPQYELPSRLTFSEKQIPKLFNQYKQQLIDLVEQDELVSVNITTYYWSSISLKTYLTVKIHYINSAFELCNFVLDTTAVQESHTGSITASKINNQLLEFNLSSKQYYDYNLDYVQFVTATIDRGTNMVNALGQQIVEKDKITFKKLKIDVQTRWNSCFLMIERFIEMYQSIFNLYDDQIIQMDHFITKPEINQFISLKKFLEPFYNITVIQKNSKSVTCSLILPKCKNIYKNILITTKEIQDEVIQELTIYLKDKFDQKIQSYEYNKDITKQILLICSYLDPKFKNLYFSSQDEIEQTNNNIQKLFEIFQSIYTPQNPNPSTETLNCQTDYKIKQFNQSIFAEYYIQQENIQEQSEIMQYNRLNPLYVETDSLLWWKHNQHQFPILSKMAKVYLNIQATSSESERSFSKAGIIVNKLRVSLSSKHLNEIIFLNKNLTTTIQNKKNQENLNKNQIQECNQYLFI
ncbi:hypothetical protein ABPG72_020572 [Tetrahymena utriculariae]